MSDDVSVAVSLRIERYAEAHYRRRLRQVLLAIAAPRLDRLSDFSDRYRIRRGIRCELGILSACAEILI